MLKNCLYLFLTLAIFSLSHFIPQKTFADWGFDGDSSPCTISFPNHSTEQLTRTTINVRVDSTDPTASMNSLTANITLNPTVNITPTLPFFYDWYPLSSGSGIIFTAYVIDIAGNLGRCDSSISPFTIIQLNPWLKTVGGDVHSNK